MSMDKMLEKILKAQETREKFEKENEALFDQEADAHTKIKMWLWPEIYTLCVDLGDGAAWKWYEGLILKLSKFTAESFTVYLRNKHHNLGTYAVVRYDRFGQHVGEAEKRIVREAVLRSGLSTVSQSGEVVRGREWYAALQEGVTTVLSCTWEGQDLSPNAAP